MFALLLKYKWRWLELFRTGHSCETHLVVGHFCRCPSLSRLALGCVKLTTCNELTEQLVLHTEFRKPWPSDFCKACHPSKTLLGLFLSLEMRTLVNQHLRVLYCSEEAKGKPRTIPLDLSSVTPSFWRMSKVFFENNGKVWTENRQITVYHVLPFFLFFPLLPPHSTPLSLPLLTLLYLNV